MVAMRLVHQTNLLEIAQSYQVLLGGNCTLTETTEPFKNKFLKRLPENQLTLLLDEKGLWLACNDGKQPLKMQPDWLAQQRRVVSAGKKSELLLKAAKITQDTTIIDATAGLGHDSILMAGRGAQVTMLEQQPIMYALLNDAMRQVSEKANWQKLHARLTLVHANAVDYLSKQTNQVDMVYLDPMFPDDSYKSAQVNKNMQVLHRLAKPPTPEEESALLTTALHAGKRVIVKRSRHAPFLSERPPSQQWLGDAVRYDGYVL